MGGVKSETILGAFWKAEGGSVVGLVTSAVRLRWLDVTGVWCTVRVLKFGAVFLLALLVGKLMLSLSILISSKIDGQVMRFPRGD